MPSEPAKLADLTFDAPDWQRLDSKSPGHAIARLAPADNERKESISIIRTELQPTLRDAGPAELEKVLVEAQQTLPSVKVGAPTRFSTHVGLRAIQVESDFVPRGASGTYHRVHAIVVDGTALVHVLYTARDPDPDLKAFHLVLDSIRRGEG